MRFSGLITLLLFFFAFQTHAQTDAEFQKFMRQVESDANREISNMIATIRATPPLNTNPKAWTVTLGGRQILFRSYSACNQELERIYNGVADKWIRALQNNYQRASGKTVSQFDLSQLRSQFYDKLKSGSNCRCQEIDNPSYIPPEQRYGTMNGKGVESGGNTETYYNGRPDRGVPFNPANPVNGNTKLYNEKMRQYNEQKAQERAAANNADYQGQQSSPDNSTMVSGNTGNTPSSKTGGRAVINSAPAETSNVEAGRPLQPGTAYGKETAKTAVIINEDGSSSTISTSSPANSRSSGGSTMDQLRGMAVQSKEAAEAGTSEEAYQKAADVFSNPRSIPEGADPKLNTEEQKLEEALQKQKEAEERKRREAERAKNESTEGYPNNAPNTSKPGSGTSPGKPPAQPGNQPGGNSPNGPPTAITKGSGKPEES